MFDGLFGTTKKEVPSKKEQKKGIFEGIFDEPEPTQVAGQEQSIATPEQRGLVTQKPIIQETQRGMFDGILDKKEDTEPKQLGSLFRSRAFQDKLDAGTDTGFDRMMDEAGFKSPTVTKQQVQARNKVEIDRLNKVRGFISTSQKELEALEQKTKFVTSQTAKNQIFDKKHELEILNNSLDHYQKTFGGKRLPTKKFFDVLAETKGTDLLPFISSADQIANTMEIYNAAKRFEAGNATDVDEYVLTRYQEMAQRDQSIGAKVAEVLVGLPSFAGELLITGGIFTGVKKATQKGILKTLEKVLKRKIGKFGTLALAKIPAAVVGGTAQFIPAGATRIPISTIEKMTPDFTLSKDDKGQVDVIINDSGDNFGLALTKALGDQWIEVVSEHSGGIFDELSPLTKPAKDKLMKLGFMNAFKKANPNTSVSTFNNIIKRAGWNGVLQEMGEEEIGRRGRGVLFEAGLGDEEYKMPTKQQLLVELIAFSAPGLGFAATKNILGRSERKKDKEFKNRFENLLIKEGEPGYQSSLSPESGLPSNNIVAPNLPKSGLETKDSPSLTKTLDPVGASKSTRYTSPSQEYNFDDSLSILDNYNTISKNYQDNQVSFSEDLKESTGINPNVMIKKEDSWIGKVERYKIRGKTPNEIADTLAGRVITKEQDIQTQISNIQNKFEVVEVENYFDTPTNFGYRGVNIIVKLPNGQLAEVQIHTQKSLNAADAIHPLYEKWRNFDLNKLSSKQIAEMSNDMIEGNRIYESAKETVDERKEKEISEDKEEYLYHGTNEDVLDNIIKKGLEPGRRGLLSLSKDETYAKSFARTGITPKGKTKAIQFRVKSDLLKGKTSPVSKTKPKSDQLFEVLTKETIPPESIEIFKDGKWQPLKAPATQETKKKETKKPEPKKEEKKPEPKKKKVGKVAKSIEAKAKEKGIAADFKNIRGYEPVVIKEQMKLIQELMDTDIESAKQMAIGEKPLPNEIKGAMLIKMMEDYAMEKGDGELILGLANSPILDEISTAGQQLRLIAERVPDSATVRIAEIKKEREKAVEKKMNKKSATEIKGKMKETLDKKLNSSKKKISKASWENLLLDIAC